MTLCLFSSIFFVLFANLSFGSLRISQVNRAFMNSYKGMYEASVITIDEEGEPITPYYDQTILRNYVTDYLEENIKKCVTDYTLNIDFYKNDEEKATPEELSRKVKISIDANINFLFHYSKDQTYSIKSRDSLWLIN